VDDIIITTKADPREWKEIKSIMNLFYQASGLQINESKSTFHYVGLLAADIETFKLIFPLGYQAISLGLRYLGYFIKPDCYKATDWNLLLIKFQKRIAHWCNRWLTLGGRYILLKSVLEG
jgi:hypothetical protein